MVFSCHKNSSLPLFKLFFVCTKRVAIYSSKWLIQCSAMPEKSNLLERKVVIGFIPDLCNCSKKRRHRHWIWSFFFVPRVCWYCTVLIIQNFAFTPVHVLYISYYNSKIVWNFLTAIWHLQKQPSFLTTFIICATWTLLPSGHACLSESSVLQLKLKALILDIIHNISVVKQLNQAGVTSPDAWAWQKQLRFYMGTDKCCLIHMVDAEFRYTYEYQVCWQLDRR